MDADHRRALGELGEASAALLLEEAGYAILERNWRDSRRGELDLVAEGDEGIVIVEVRTRVGDGRGSALESIDARKLARLRRLAAAWARSHGAHRALRVDAIAWTIPPGRRDEALAVEPGTDLRAIGARHLWIRGIA